MSVLETSILTEMVTVFFLTCYCLFFSPYLLTSESSRNTRVLFFFDLAWKSNVEQLLQNQFSSHLPEISVVSTQCLVLQKSFVISFGQFAACLPQEIKVGSG